MAGEGYSRSARFYRIVGIGTPDGREKDFAPPPSLGILDALVSVRTGSALFGMAKRTRCASESVARKQIGVDAPIEELVRAALRTLARV